MCCSENDAGGFARTKSSLYKLVSSLRKSMARMNISALLGIIFSPPHPSTAVHHVDEAPRVDSAPSFQQFPIAVGRLNPTAMYLRNRWIGITIRRELLLSRQSYTVRYSLPISHPAINFPPLSVIAYPPKLGPRLPPWYSLVASSVATFPKRKSGAAPLLPPRDHSEYALPASYDWAPRQSCTFLCEVFTHPAYSRLTSPDGTYSYTHLPDAYKTSPNSFSDSPKSASATSIGGFTIAGFMHTPSPSFEE